MELLRAKSRATRYVGLWYELDVVQKQYAGEVVETGHRAVAVIASVIAILWKCRKQKNATLLRQCDQFFFQVWDK